MRESFILYKSFYEPIKDLSNEKKGLLLDAIFVYQINGTEIELPSDLKMAFTFFKNQFRLDDKKYSNVVERNKTNGSKGGRPKTQTNPNNPVGLKEPKKADKENGNDKDNDKEELLVIPKKNYAVEMINIWNEVCRSLPKGTLYAENRNKKLNYLIGNKNLKDNEGKPLFEEMEDWRYFCEMIEDSNFLAREWGKCNIDWVLKPANTIKIYEGNYGNKK